MKNMVNAAAVIPHDCIIREKSRATDGEILNASVMTGKAIAPPPSEVIPTQYKHINCISVSCLKKAARFCTRF